MNQIHEKDWAEDDWGCYSGMRSNPYGGGIEGELSEDNNNRAGNGKTAADTPSKMPPGINSY